MKFRFLPSRRACLQTSSRRSLWFRTSVASLAVAGFSLISPQAQALTYYWDPTQTGGTNGFGSGTWDKTTQEFYNGTSDVAWVDGNTASFGGPIGTYEVNLGVPISALGLAFTTSGYSITASATNSLTLTGTAGVTTSTSGGTTTLAGAIIVSQGNVAQTWAVGAGDTLSITGSVTQSGTTGTSNNLIFSGAGTFNYSGTAFSPYKFTISGGATMNSSGAVSIPVGGTYTGVGDGTSGTLNVTAGTFTTAAVLFLGNTLTANATDTGTFTVSGSGAVTTTSNVNVGAGYLAGSAGNANGIGILTINAGTFSTGSSTGNILVGNNGSGNGTINFNGGTFSTNSAFNRGSFSTTTTGFTKGSVLNFNGGTLQATGTSLTISGTGLTVNVRNSGAIIDTNGFAVSLGGIFIHSGIAGDNATDGGFTKNGAGALTLTSANTFNGTTVINAGSIVIGNASALQNSTLNYNNQGGTLSFGTQTAVTLGGLSGAQNLVLTNTATTPAAVVLSVGNNNANTTYSGALSGLGGLTKIGTGALTLTGGNSFAGTLTLSAGTLNINNTGATGAGPISLNGGIIDNTSGSAITSTNNSAVTFGGSTGFAFGGTNSLNVGTGTVTIGGDRTITLNGNNANTLTFGAAVNGSNAAHTLTVNNAAGVSGETLVLSGFALQSATGTGGISDVFNGTGSLAITGAITNGGTSGANGMSKSGTGSLTLSGANTFTGTLSITAGTLNVNSAGALGAGTFSIGGGVIDNTSGAAIATSTSNPVVTLAGNFGFGGTNSLNTGTGTVSNATDRTITLNGSNTNTLAFGGVLQNTSTTSGFNITVNNATGVTGETLSFNNGFNMEASGGTGGITDIFSGSGKIIVNGVIANGSASGVNGLTYSGTGTLTLNGANTYGGTTTVSSGTLALGNSSATLGATASAPLSVSGGTLDIGAASPSVGGTTITSGTILSTSGTPGTLTATSYTATTGTNTISANLAGGGSTGFVQKNGGTTTLSGNNSYTGGTNINTSGGTLILGSNTALGSTSGSLTVNTSGILDITTYSPTVGAVSLAGGTIQSTGSTTATLTGSSFGVTSGTVTVGLGGATAALTKTSSGTVVLSGANSYGGGTTVTAGTLTLSGTNSSTTGTTSFAATQLNINNVGALSGGVFSLNSAAAGIIDNTSGAAITGQTNNPAVSLGGTGVTFAGSNSLNLGTGTVSLPAGFTFTLNGTNNNTLTFGGLLQNTSTTRSYTITVNNGASASGETLIFNNGYNLEAAGATGNTNPAVINGSGNITINGVVANGTANFNNSLTYSGTGILTLAGANTYSGGTTVSSGTVQAGAATSAFGSNPAVSIGNVAGATLALNGFNETIGSLAGGGTTGGEVALGGGTLTVGGDNTTTAYSGIITGAGGLVKNGTGTFGLKGANTYSGPTTLNGFVDAYSATAFGAVGAGNGTTINTGGTVRFRDASNVTVAEPFTLNGGSFLSYNNPGTATFSGQFTLNTNSLIQISPQSQASTSTVFSTGFSEGGSGSNLTFARVGAAGAASADTVLLTGASTYGGATYITDALTTNTGVFSVRLSGGDNRLPIGTVVTLGGNIGGAGAAAGNGRLVLGDATSGAVSQTIAGLTTNGTGTGNAVSGGASAISTLIVNNTASYTYGGLLGGVAANANNLALTKSGSGTFTLTGASTYVGATTINGGTLDLGGSTSTGSISSSSALTMGNGTLNYTRTGNTNQTFASTTFNSGQSTINVASGDTLNLGAITRNTGATAYFGTTGNITTSTTNGDGNTNTGNTNGFLGAYALYGSYDWASNNGSKITYFSGYSYYDYVAGWNGNVNGKDVSDDNNGYDGTSTVAMTINSLRFNEGNADSTVNIYNNNNLTISSGGILVTPNLGSKYARINGGGLTTGNSADLVIQQWNTGGGHLQIGSSIFGAGGLTKAGPGQLDLNGSDATYTGVTTVNGGTLQATAGITGTTSVVVNNSGTLLLGANDRINDAATVTLNGGTINTGGFKEGAATGTSAATAGLGALTLSTTSVLDFGSGHSGSSVLAFASSNTQTWNGTLTLLNFVVGTDELNFASSTGLTTTQLGEISLSGFTATGLDSFGDVLFSSTAVPEPATVFGGVLMVGALGWHLRRRTTRRVVA